MDIMIYATERCNLECKYCEKVEVRDKFVQDINYDTADLVKFLKKVQNFRLHFYGGEPLLHIPVIKKILDEIQCKHVAIQTNGLMLDKIDKRLYDKIDVFSISLDGPEEITDSFRGKGVYKKAIDQVKKLKKARYKSPVNVRMTISPGVDIEQCVMHFISNCDIVFDSIHWQLNVLFHSDDAWYKDKAKVKKWFRESYNPGISELVKMWTKEITENNIVLQLIPFVGIMHSMITKTSVEGLRCGAGTDMIALTTTGDIYPCPVMRNYPKYCLGCISDDPANFAQTSLVEPCTSCEVLDICGGRCLCTNLENEWDDEGYGLVCDSVKHLLKELKNVYPEIKRCIDQNEISLSEFEIPQDYEIIP